MRHFSETLIDLITLSENVITRPRYATPGSVDFDTVAAEVRHADAQPAEGVRTTRAAMAMVNAIEGFRATAGEAGSMSESPWLMLAGCALPLLRVDAWLARANEKAARES